MSTFEDSNARLMIGTLDSLSDSQFLGWLAMSYQDLDDNPLAQYVTQRINIIALSASSEPRKCDEPKTKPY